MSRQSFLFVFAIFGGYWAFGDDACHCAIVQDPNYGKPSGGIMCPKCTKEVEEDVERPITCGGNPKGTPEGTAEGHVCVNCEGMIGDDMAWGGGNGGGGGQGPQNGNSPLPLDNGMQSMSAANSFSVSATSSVSLPNFDDYTDPSPDNRRGPTVSVPVSGKCSHDNVLTTTISVPIFFDDKNGDDDEGGDDSPGSSRARLDPTVVWETSLGRTTGDRSSGKLQLFGQKFLKSSISTPSALTVEGGREIDIVREWHSPEDLFGGGGAVSTGPGGISPIRDERTFLETVVFGGISQILATECFVNITTQSVHRFTISFYTPDAVKSERTMLGTYELHDDAFAYVTYTVENPDGANALERLLITESRYEDGAGSPVSINVTEFAWQRTDSGLNWVLIGGDGGYKTCATAGNTKLHTTYGADDVRANVVEKTYESILRGSRLPVKIVVDPDGAALTTTTTYYGKSSGTNRNGQVASKSNPDGTKIYYDYNPAGRLSLVKTNWLDVEPTPPNDDPVPPVDPCKVTTYSYIPLRFPAGSSTPADSGVTDPGTPRVESVYIGGICVSMTLRAISMDNQAYRTIEEVQVLDPSAVTDLTAAWADPANPHTIAVYMPKDDFKPCSRQLESITYPDGRTRSYVYTPGDFTPGANGLPGTFAEVAQGGDWFCTTITEGTKDHPNGIPFRTTREVIIAKKAGKKEVLRETQVCVTTGQFERVSWTATTRDNFDRVTMIRHSDGTCTETGWTGRRMAWATGVDGVRTDFEYDSRGRRIRSIRRGHDVRPDLITTVTYDTNNRVLATVVSSDNLVQATSNRYDTAGRLVWTRSADGIETVYRHYDDKGGAHILPVGFISGRGTATIRGYGTPLATESTTAYHRDGSIAYTLFNGARKATYEHGVNENGTTWTTLYEGSQGANSPAWSTSTRDALGRTIEECRPGYNAMLVTRNEYDAAGRLMQTSLISQIPDSPDSLISSQFYQYDELGGMTCQAQDVNLNDTIDLAGPDQVSSSTSAYVKLNNQWWQETKQYTYPENGSAEPLLVSTYRSRLTGLGTVSSTQIGNVFLTSETISIDALGNTSTQQSFLNRATRSRLSLSQSPTSTLPSYSISACGLSLTNVTATGIVTSRAYDALGRPVAITNGRGSTTTMTYNSLGQLAYTEDALANLTTFTYDLLGRRIAVTDALNQTTHTAYDVEGRVTQTWGATYPVAYDYDEFGRMTALHTWRDENGEPDTTQWLYDDATGLLLQKLYADNKGPSYTYTPDGQLATRTWARGIITDYTYDAAGNLTHIDYDDDITPSVSFTYDRLGNQLSAITDGVVTNLYAYSILGQLTAETTITADTTSTLTRAYDALGRPTGHSLGAPGVSPEYAVTYGYDTFGRFSTLTTHSPSLSTVNSSLLTTYAYLPGTDLISGLAYDTIGHQWTRTYEPSRNLIASVQTHHNSTLLASYDYANDAIGRRTSIARSGTLYDAPVQDHYGYNERSEVISARRYLSPQPLALSPQPSLEVPGFAYDYTYDAIGNRITATEYDHANLPLVSNYTSNELNQYEQRTVPGYAAVRGVSDPGTFVAVNDNPALQVPPFFYGGDDVDNTQSPVLHPLTITAARPANDPQQLLTVNFSLSTEPDAVTTETGSLFVPQTPETFTYDDDGNLVSDGRFSYMWDAENRLIRAETLPDISTLYTLHSTLSHASPVRVDYTYDHQYRRIAKRVYTLASSQAWALSETRHFLYDGWNLIREAMTSSSSSSPSITHYTWGLDLSGTLQGAGGVGGLQLVTIGNALYFPVCDANGNINGYANSSGTLVARYEYSPLGETLAQSGEMADEIAFRFSSKYNEKESGLYYYGYRYYVSTTGKWGSRDVIGEEGGLNLYNFCGNSCINSIDYFGLSPCDCFNTKVLGQYQSDWFWRLFNYYEMIEIGDGAIVPKHTTLYFEQPEKNGSAKLISVFAQAEPKKSTSANDCCDDVKMLIRITGWINGEWQNPNEIKFAPDGTRFENQYVSQIVPDEHFKKFDDKVPSGLLLYKVEFKADDELCKVVNFTVRFW